MCMLFEKTNLSKKELLGIPMMPEPITTGKHENRVHHRQPIRLNQNRPVEQGCV